MAKQDVLLKDVEIPAGWEPTGEFRPAKKGEAHVDGFGNFFAKSDGSHYRDCVATIILRRIEPTHVKLARTVLELTKPETSFLKCGDTFTLAKQVLSEWEASAK